MLEPHDNFQVKNDGNILIKAGEEIVIAKVKNTTSSVVKTLARPQFSLFGLSSGGGGLFGPPPDTPSVFGFVPSDYTYRRTLFANIPHTGLFN